jgi:hypothetical protein
MFGGMICYIEIEIRSAYNDVVNLQHKIALKTVNLRQRIISLRANFVRIYINITLNKR